MKFNKIIALLGLSSLPLHAGTFGLAKPFAKLSEEDLEKIENALENAETETLKQELERKEEKIKSLELKEKELEAALQKLDAVTLSASELAGIETQATTEQTIVLLGEKCKEYGESKNRHSLSENNGKDESTDGLIEGYLDPNDEHNKFLKSI